MNHVEVTRVLPHPIDRVFARYTDHVGWGEWTGLGPVRLAREGTPHRDGVGCVRAFPRAGSLQEEVLVYEPPTRMEYSMIQGPVPMSDHRGVVRFEPEGEGTRVTWTVDYRWRIPGTGWLSDLGLRLLFERLLAALERDLDARRAG